MLRSPVAFILTLVLVLTLAATQAQDEAAPSDATLQVVESPEWGPHLVGPEGMSLYMYTSDEEGASACMDACAVNWPPLTVDGEPVVGEGVDPALVQTVERPDGTTQIAYDGMPLYRYVRDTEPGTTLGQGLGGAFFLVSPAGEPLQERVAQEGVELAEDVLAPLMETGATVYASNCAVCHGAEGQGQIGPRLAENANVGRTEFLVTRILNGFPEHGMPAFRTQLDDLQIAAVSTYVRNTWGNEYPGVTEEEVTELR